MKNKSTAQILDEILKSYSLSRNSGQEKKLNRKYHELQKLFQSEMKKKLAAPPIKSGSIAKSTVVNFKFDLDMVIPFRADAYSNIPTMFKEVGKLLQRHNLKPRKQRVSYGISVDNTFIDIVPGIELNLNGYKSSKGDLYLYDSNKKVEIKTNLNRQLNNLKDLAKKDNQVLDIIRFMKSWKLKENIHLKSFMLELLTINAQKNHRAKDLASKLLWNFKYISLYLDHPLYDPGNSRNNVLETIKPTTIKNLKDRMSRIYKELSVAFEESDEKIIKKYFPKR